MTTLRDRLLAVPDQVDPSIFPPGFQQARSLLHRAITHVELTYPPETVLAVLLAETLPRFVNAYGPAHAAAIMNQLAADIASGAAPNCNTQ